MADFNPAISVAANQLIPGEAKKRGGLDFRVYQDLKTSIHRDLLNKVDLEKVATVRDDRKVRRSWIFESAVWSVGLKSI